MLGFVALVFGELVDLKSPSPLIQGDARVVVASTLLAVTAAVIMAFNRRQLAGGLLLEAVTASLTSAQRSASSLTTTSPFLDKAVDKVLAEAFDKEMTIFLAMSLPLCSKDEVFCLEDDER